MLKVIFYEVIKILVCLGLGVFLGSVYIYRIGGF
jgi:hypothetical protein